MAKIYISSTSSDLEYHRKRAYAQMRKHGHDVLSMEDYNPSTRRPIHKCREDVRNTDIYVVLIGWQYGSIPKNDNPKGYSYTENEYDEALTHGKEIIALLVDDQEPWPPALMDHHSGDHEAGTKVNAFRARVSANHLRGKFTTPDQLAAALSPAVDDACKTLRSTQNSKATTSRSKDSQIRQNFALEYVDLVQTIGTSRYETSEVSDLVNFLDRTGLSPEDIKTIVEKSQEDGKP